LFKNMDELVYILIDMRRYLLYMKILLHKIIFSVDIIIYHFTSSNNTILYIHIIRVGNINCAFYSTPASNL
jgi:hypothetical protein